MRCTGRDGLPTCGFGHLRAFEQANADAAGFGAAALANQR
jgi:hypothetical protein